MRAFVAALFAILTFDLASSSPDVPSKFDQANQLYEKGEFRAAAEQYEQLIGDGILSANVLFNLGNARFKAGDLGHAIAAYRKAHRLAPRDPDIQANLNFARQAVGSASPTGHVAQKWLGPLTLDELTFCTVASYWLWFALLSLRQLSPGVGANLGTLSRVLALATLTLSIWLGISAYHTLRDQTAVVIVDQAVARFGPSSASQSAFKVEDGAEVRVLDHKGTWVQVTGPEGNKGWVLQSAILPVP